MAAKEKEAASKPPTEATEKEALSSTSGLRKAIIAGVALILFTIGMVTLRNWIHVRDEERQIQALNEPQYS